MSRYETLIEPLCSECATAPWKKHASICVPCHERILKKRVASAERRAANEALDKAIKRLKEWGHEPGEYMVDEIEALKEKP